MSRSRFQFAPAIPGEVWRIHDVPQETAPFHQRALDVARAQRIAREPVARPGIGRDFADYFRRARAVMRRCAHFEITRMIGPIINALAKNAEPSAHGASSPAKPRAAADVREIENEIVDRVGFVFKRGGNRETFAGLEEREDDRRGASVFRPFTKPSRRQA